MGLRDLGYKPRRSVVRVILDDTVRQELDEARAQLRAEQARPDRGLGSDSEQRVEEAEAAAELAAVSFVFEAIPRHKLAELIAACPPTSAQLDSWKEEDRNNPLLIISPPAFDIDKFPPRLIAASLVEPVTTTDEVVEMWESGSWSDSIWDELWKTAWDKTNRGVSTLPTSGTGSAKTAVSGPK
jgi:hypothetical protein